MDLTQTEERVWKGQMQDFETNLKVYTKLNLNGNLTWVLTRTSQSIICICIFNVNIVHIYRKCVCQCAYCVYL